MSGDVRADGLGRRIGILGAGAMGTLFGARLASAGLAVTLVDIDEPLLAALRSEGARCMTDGGLISAPVQALRAEQLQSGPALWLVFTKSAHTRAALQGIAHLIDAQTRFLSLQNGIGHEQVLQQFVGAGRVAVGVTTWPGRVTAPGQVSSLGQGAIRFMPVDGPADGTVDAVFAQLASDLNLAGLNCRIDAQVREAIWEKLAFNAAFNGVCGVTRLTVDGLANPVGEALIAQVLDEVLAVAHAHGVAASAPRVRQAVREALDHHRGHQPSMLQDLLAGRATETAAIHGAVLQAAGQLGLQVPVTRTLHQLVRLCEQAAGAPAGH